MSRVGRHALEAGDDRDLARRERVADAVGPDLDDLGLAVLGVGDDPGLAPGEAHRGLAEVLDRHREQRHRDALARGEQHVHLAAAGPAGDVVGEAHEVVGGLAHRRDDDDDVVARRGACARCGRRRRGCGRVGDRGPAELLHEQPTASQATGDARRPRRDSRPVHSAAVPSADKRQRKKENARLRRRGARGAPRSAEAQSRRSATRRSQSASSSIVIVLVHLLGGDNKKSAPTPDDVDDDGNDSVATLAAGCVNTVPNRGDEARTSRRPDDHRSEQDVHRDDLDDVRRHHDRARREERAEERQQLRVPRAAGLLRRAEMASGRQGLRRSRAATRRATAPADPGYTIDRRAARRTATRSGALAVGEGRRAIPPARRVAVLHRAPAIQGAHRPNEYARTIGESVTSRASANVQKIEALAPVDATTGAPHRTRSTSQGDDHRVVAVARRGRSSRPGSSNVFGFAPLR